MTGRGSGTTASFPWRLVTVDIDGTLTLCHGWKTIARAFGRSSEFEQTRRRFRAHEIAEGTYLAELLALATGHTPAEVHAVLERTPKLRGIAEGVRELHRLGARAALLSHNPAYVVEWYRRRFGFDDGEGVHGQGVERGRIGRPAGIRAGKIGGLGRLLARLATPAAQVAHVGDGTSDAVLFRRVGGGIALNAASAEVRKAADVRLITTDFGDVVKALRRLHPRPISGAPRRHGGDGGPARASKEPSLRPAAARTPPRRARGR
jgi:phosphoserine phosphatase